MRTSCSIRAKKIRQILKTISYAIVNSINKLEILCSVPSYRPMCAEGYQYRVLTYVLRGAHTCIDVGKTLVTSTLSLA